MLRIKNKKTGQIIDLLGVWTTGVRKPRRIYTLASGQGIWSPDVEEFFAFVPRRVGDSWSFPLLPAKDRQWDIL